MEPFDGRKGKKLSKEIVSDFRFFGYYIGNETLEHSLPGKIDTSIVFEQSDALGNLYAIRLFRQYDKQGKHTAPGERPNASVITVNYLKCLHNNDLTGFEFPFTKEELADKHDWRAVLSRFMLDVGNRTLDTIPLKDFDCEDYGDGMIDDGGSMERMTAIFCNILRMDQNNHVINEEWCRYRASQFIRACNDESYQIKPPLKDWETMLWL